MLKPAADQKSKSIKTNFSTRRTTEELLNTVNRGILEKLLCTTVKPGLSCLQQQTLQCPVNELLEEVSVNRAVGRGTQEFLEDPPIDRIQ